MTLPPQISEFLLEETHIGATWVRGFLKRLVERLYLRGEQSREQLERYAICVLQAIVGSILKERQIDRVEFALTLIEIMDEVDAQKLETSGEGKLH